MFSERAASWSRPMASQSVVPLLFLDLDLDRSIALLLFLLLLLLLLQFMLYLNAFYLPCLAFECYNHVVALP